MSECTHEWAHFFPSSSLFFCNQVLKPFPGSLALHVRYASVYCVYKSWKKEQKKGECVRRRWERHLLSVWRWKNFDCENVSPPQTSTQPWKNKDKNKLQKVRDPNKDASHWINAAWWIHSRHKNTVGGHNQKGVWLWVRSWNSPQKSYTGSSWEEYKRFKYTTWGD